MWAIISTAISIAALLVSYLAYLRTLDKLFTKKNIRIGGYQAVFLTNGQVYFGKITEVDKELVKLEYIYYLPPEIAAEKATQINLIKLGNELHGPDDMMFIDRSHIIFWENLKEDGEVVKAIRGYETAASRETTNMIGNFMDSNVLKNLNQEDRKDLTKFYLGLLHTSIHARMAMLPSISALCATLLVLATFNDELLPLNNIVKILISILLIIVPLALLFYNSQLKKEQASYIRTLGESVSSSMSDKIVGHFPDFAIYLITGVIVVVIYLIWAVELI